MAQLLSDGTVIVTLAMCVGVLAVAMARHLRIPGIVLLLGAGVALGPDGLGLIRPASLGAGRQVLVSFAVAVILFEGGLNLQFAKLRRQAKPIRRLVTVGALTTAAGGSVAAHFFMGYSWPLSALFGSLVIVTGPTVINPIIRRIGLRDDLATILEAEGIFIDAVGATIAVMALEFALQPTGQSFAHGALGLATRMGFGALVGGVFGGVLAALLRHKAVIPHGLENILGLSFAVAAYQLSDGYVHESGITAAIVAGMVVGNAGVHAHEQLVEFKEQLTVLFIATLFVVLSADVRVDQVLDLGWPGVWTTLALMFLVRPVTVAASTFGSGLSLKSKAFLSWLAPRGIVAAAVASLFAEKLASAGIPEGESIKALVFLVIAATVVVQGLSGGVVASALGLRKKTNMGFVILGANALARVVAGVLRSRGEEVVLIDANPHLARAAEAEGFKVVYGNGLQDRTLLRARIGTRRGAIALTENESVNLLFAERVRALDRTASIWVALETDSTGVTTKMLGARDIHLLFGKARRVEHWRARLNEEGASVERWRFEADTAPEAAAIDAPPGLLMPLAGWRGDNPLIPDERYQAQRGDLMEFAYYPGEDEPARTWLQSAGWVPPEESRG